VDEYEDVSAEETEQPAAPREPLEAPEPRPWRVDAPPVAPNLLRKRPPRPGPRVAPYRLPGPAGAIRPNRVVVGRLRLVRKIGS